MTGRKPSTVVPTHRDGDLNCWMKILAALLTAILISSGSSSSSYNAAAAVERFIQIPALKRVSQLGYLYNEKTDNFIPVGVFRRTISKEFITEVETTNKGTYTEITDSLIDTFNFFSIDKNTAVNILAGITEPQGALSLLKGKTQSSQQQMTGTGTGTGTGTLLYKYQTLVQTLESFQDGLKENYNRDIMGHIEATHVVTTITWGSQVAVQVQVEQQPDSIGTNLDTQVSRNLLKAELRSLRGQLTPADQILSNVSMTVTSDLLLPFEIPTTTAQVKEMLSQVPRLAGDLNEGKGIPLSYTLTPINLIRKHLGVYLQNTTATKLNEFALNEIIEVFQDLHSAAVELYQLNNKIRSYSNSNYNCIPQQTEIKLNDFQSKFRVFKTSFTTTVKKSLIEVRSGLKENTVLSDLVVVFSESDFEPNNLRRQVKDFDRDLEKIKFCRDFQNNFNNITYFGAENHNQGVGLINSLSKIESDSSQSPIFILFTKFEYIQNEPAKYLESMGLLLGKINGTARTAVFIDCDFPHSLCNNVNETSVVHYQNGSISALQIHPTDSFPTCARGSCKNGGTHFIKSDPKIFCECAAGFIAEYCEEVECAHPGTCITDVTIPASCKCRQGYVKDARDPRKCLLSLDNATLLFNDPAGIQQFSINQRNTTRIVADTNVHRALDFHYRTEMMFWSAHGGKIYSSQIFAGSPKTLVLTDTGSSILSIAIDWVHNHLYYTDGNGDKISVVNLDGSMKKVLINDGLDFPTSIVVNPLDGWMYWVDEFKKKIERSGMDGSRREIIVTTHPSSPYGLTLDYTDNRLFWTTLYTHPNSIYSVKPDGSDTKLVLRAAPPTFATTSNFNSITIFEDYMYWRDHSAKKMYRANKCNGEELTELISPLDHYKTVQVYHFSKQPEVANQCANRGLQCSHLCLPIPSIGNETRMSTICTCPDGSTLSSDTHTCS